MATDATALGKFVKQQVLPINGEASLDSLYVRQESQWVVFVQTIYSVVEEHLSCQV
jgi:hypothetical protein